ncbi:FAD-dependent oxidoreductase [Microvirga roseola]|uniref:FAD-dependent oxidoreductase n=1 Tax=Microvirga roseola TaxID=2883126 RepID=UPI001E55856F|nr:FAD-dependent oxidoreductase [Microvirga roseola]
MASNRSQANKNLLLVGGGHAHVFVLEAFARNPEPGLRLILVAKDVRTPYSGMLPGHLAGLYSRDEMHIDLEVLARRSGATLIQDEAVGFDAAGKRALLRSGEALSYDILSIDIGITPDLSGIEGAAEHALAVKPIGDLLEKWDRLVEKALRPDGPRRFAIIGGGVAGICLAFAVRAFLGTRLSDPLHLALIGASDAPGINAGMRRRIARAFERRGIEVFKGEAAGVDPKGVTLSSGERIAADAVLVSTHAAPPPALAGTDWAKDEHGFLAIRPTLQVLNDNSVFAAGDCATMPAHPRPKAGVFAVRQGPVLARNLRRYGRGEALEEHRPQRKHLVLISTGDGRAIGGRGRFVAFQGRFAWRLKDWLDRRFMRRFT